jgi:hypothetical protein
VSSAGAARISLLSESEAESSSSSRRRTSGRREAVRPAPAPVRGGRPRARTGDGTVGREGCARRRGPRADSPAAADYRGAHDFVSLVSHGRDPTAAVEALERRRGRGYDRMCSPPRSPTPIRCYARRILPTRGGASSTPSRSRSRRSRRRGFRRVPGPSASSSTSRDVRAAAQRSWSVPRQPLDAAFLFAVS